MIETITIRENALPSDMGALLKDYPRETWTAHPNFKQATQNWLGAHRAFRKLSKVMREETQSYLNHDLPGDELAGGLAYYGDALVRNLYGHHHWEDRSYFPELSAADPRFDTGLAILEKDHVCFNDLLEQLTRKANRVIKLVQLDETAAYDEAGELLPITQKVQTLLTRHLSDEEELAVPIILHHKLRG